MGSGETPPDRPKGPMPPVWRPYRCVWSRRRRRGRCPRSRRRRRTRRGRAGPRCAPAGRPRCRAGNAPARSRRAAARAPPAPRPRRRARKSIISPLIPWRIARQRFSSISRSASGARRRRSRARRTRARSGRCRRRSGRRARTTPRRGSGRRRSGPRPCRRCGGGARSTRAGSTRPPAGPLQHPTKSA